MYQSTASIFFWLKIMHYNLDRKNTNNYKQSNTIGKSVLTLRVQRSSDENNEGKSFIVAKLVGYRSFKL